MCLFYFILFFLNHLRSLDTASLTELCESICIAGKLKKMRLLAGFIFTTFFSFFFFFLMKEPCPLTFKSLSLQRKTASLIDTWEAVITLMKHRIKQLYFFCPWFHLLIWKYPVLQQKRTLSCCVLLSHSPAGRCRNSGKRPSTSSAPVAAQWNTISSSHGFYFKLQIYFATQKHSHLPAQSCNYSMAAINLSFSQLKSMRIKAMEILHILQYFC